MASRMLSRSAFPTLQAKRAAGCLREQVSRLRCAAQHDVLPERHMRSLSRRWVKRLHAVKSGARAVLMAGGYGSAQGQKEMRELERDLIDTEYLARRER